MVETVGRRVEALARLDIFGQCGGEELRPLAERLQPLRAHPGEVLMRQGNPADQFLIVFAGSVEIHRRTSDGSEFRVQADSGRVVGEIALLRATERSATVTVTRDLTGWIGDGEAFDALIELPGVLDQLIRTARQRLAGFITPVALQLKDGAHLLLRPSLPGDPASIENSHITFSDETLYRRFQGARRPTPKLLRYLFEVDYIDHFVWVVVTQDGEPVADARFVRDEANAKRAEIAFTVADDYQGKGIGTFLMGALWAAARVASVEVFHARVLADNKPMRAILNHFGAQWRRDDLGVVVTEIEVPEADPFDPELTERIEQMARRVLEAF